MSHFPRRRFLQQGALALGAGAVHGLAWAQPGAAPLYPLSLTEVAARIRQRTLRSTDLVRALFVRIDQLEPKLNA